MSGELWFVALICCGIFLFGTWWAAAWTARREVGESDNWKLGVLIAGGILVLASTLLITVYEERRRARQASTVHP